MAEIIINKYSEDGICYPKISLNIRTIPCATTGVILDQYHLGESVIYDQVVITDKYTWISWLSTSGRRVYMAIKDRLTEERFGDCYDIPSSSTGTETIVQEYSESGICYPRMTMNIRDLPCASTGTILDQYYVGESVIYDYVVKTDKYVWISWISRSGSRRYIAVKDIATGERLGDCADVPNGLGESNTPTGVETIVNEYSESGICYPQMTTSIRTIPCATNGVVLDYYYIGESVVYDYVVITNKYVWVSWAGASGRRVYMTVKDQITGERWGICGDVSGGSGGSGSGIGMPGVKKIFIDAGHGGSDPGASGNGLKEKDIVLSIAQKLTSLFNSKGIQASHSRYSDTSVGLAERAEMANNWGADLFISIHANALDGSGSAYGTECYTHPNSTAENKRISADISSSISSNLGTYNRGHREADFAVLRLAKMPAILIETAFIDNAQDAYKLQNKQDEFASAIFTAITGSKITPPTPTPPTQRKEMIVISGSENDYDPIPPWNRFKYNFIETAIKKLKELKNIQSYNEQDKITWLISTKKYSATDLENFRDSAKKLGVNIVFFDIIEDLINYLNSDRTNFKIDSLTVYSHGYPGWIALGADSSNSSKLALKPSDIVKINRNSFHFLRTEFYSCNTGVAHTPVSPLSFADYWQNHIGGYTKAAMCKTDYTVIFGFGDEQIKEHVSKRSYKGYVEEGSKFYPELDLDAPSSDRKWLYLPQ